MSVAKITPSQIKIINKRIEETLAALGSELGLTFSCGNTSYSDTEASVKLTYKTQGNEEAKIADINQVGMYMGLGENCYGQTFSHGGRNFTLVDIKTRNRKYPIITQDSSGAKYKMPLDLVKSYLGQPA